MHTAEVKGQVIVLDRLINIIEEFGGKGSWGIISSLDFIFLFSRNSSVHIPLKYDGRILGLDSIKDIDLLSEGFLPQRVIPIIEGYDSIFPEPDVLVLTASVTSEIANLANWGNVNATRLGKVQFVCSNQAVCLSDLPLPDNK